MDKLIAFILIFGGIMISVGNCQHLKKNKTAIINTNVTLDCNISNPLWIRSNIHIAFPKQNNFTLNGNYKYHLIRTSNERYDLQILNVSYADEDKYCCLGNHLMECTYVHVADEPYVSPTDLDKEVCENTAVSLPCSYLSYPNMSNATHIFWKKDGERLNSIKERITGSTLSQPSLTIKNSSVEDSGLYQCHVVSSAGKLQGVAIKLLVKKFLSIVPTEDVIETTEDSNITLQCDYESCLMVPILEVFWTKRLIKRKHSDIQRTIIQRAVSKPSLLIHRVNVYDSGIYTCHVKAASYAATGEDILLLVKEKSKENHVIIIGAAVGSGMALLLGIFGITMIALRLQFRRQITLNNQHQNTASNPLRIDENQQNRENNPEENVESDQSTNDMINAYNEIDESQMIETIQLNIDASTPIVTNPPQRYKNTVLTSSPVALARRYENTILTTSRGPEDGESLKKGVGKGQHNIIKQNIFQEMCEQKRVMQTFDNNKCFGLNNLQVLEYEEPCRVLKNDSSGSFRDIQDKIITAEKQIEDSVVH